MDWAMLIFVYVFIMWTTCAIFIHCIYICICIMHIFNGPIKMPLKLLAKGTSKSLSTSAHLALLFIKLLGNVRILKYASMCWPIYMYFSTYIKGLTFQHFTIPVILIINLFTKTVKYDLHRKLKILNVNYRMYVFLYI